MIDHTGRQLAVGRFGTDKAGYAQLLAAGRAHSERVWAVEGCNGIGRHIAHRLVHDGEVVLDVPAKLSAQVRTFGTGNGRKTDPVDEHSVALAALYAPPDPGLQRESPVPESREVLRPDHAPAENGWRSPGRPPPVRRRPRQPGTLAEATQRLQQAGMKRSG